MEVPDALRVTLGESKIAEFSKIYFFEFCASSYIVDEMETDDFPWVFCNLDDYPIPIPSHVADLRYIRRNIRKGLEEMGFDVIAHLWGYADNLQCGVDVVCRAGIGYIPQRHISVVSSMTLDMLILSLSQKSRQNFLVLAKQIPGSELERVLRCLQSRNVGILVADDRAKNPFQSAESVLECSWLGGGKEKRGNRSLVLCPPDYEWYLSTLCQEIAEKKLSLEDVLARVNALSPLHDDEFVTRIQTALDAGNYELTSGPVPEPEPEPTHSCDSRSVAISQFDTSKIEDFSVPITPIKGDNAVVFWDVVDCPFPLGSKPDEIYRRIASALGQMGCGDKLAIFAYVDEKNGPWNGDYLRTKKWESRIYFLPRGDPRDNRMLHDYLLWEMDSPVHDPYVIIVSYQIREGTHLFKRLWRNVLYVTPTEHVNKPQSPEWPGLLLDTVCWARENSSVPNPKKPKTVAA